MKVYVVYSGPDMTYYGDAELHAAFSTEEQANAMAREMWAKDHPNWPGGWDGGSANVYVGELTVDADE